MKIRKFTAPSVPLALRQVHDDLGDRAVILNTRTLPAGGDPDVRVEVTATLGEEDADPMATTASGQQLAAGVASEARPARGPRPDLLGRVYGRSHPAGNSPRGPRLRETEPRPQVGEKDISTAAEWLASLPAVQRDRTEAIRPEPQEPPAQMHDTTEGAGDSVVIGQLRQLEKAVHRMASQTGGFELPPELSRLGERLRRTGLSGAHVHRCLQAVMRELSNEELDARDAIARAASRCLTGLLAGVSEIRIGRRRKVVALVGPSGSGKTTAAARIAAGFVRRRQRRGGAPEDGDIVLISTDSRRVGALAQSRAFADLIRAPLETAYDERDMETAIRTHEAARLVLVDAGGCGPHEREEMEGQKRMLVAAGVDEVHVVVDGLTGFDHIVETAKVWEEMTASGSAGPAFDPEIRLMVTKMDQSIRPGVVVSAAIDAGLPISYVTVSAAVPGGIRPGDLSPWIEWMVGLAPRPSTESVS
jgi:flagellar biosynthesis protein FlhF